MAELFSAVTFVILLDLNTGTTANNPCYNCANKELLFCDATTDPAYSGLPMTCVCAPQTRCMLDHRACFSTGCSRIKLSYLSNGLRCLCFDCPDGFNGISNQPCSGIGNLHTVCESSDPSDYCDINACLTNKCVNGACSFGVNGYNCTCNDGYTGTNCDEEEMCPCDCAYQDTLEKMSKVNPLPMEQLEEVMQPIVQELKKNLTMDAKNLSSTLRKKTSAPDERPSAQNVGYLGIALLTLVLVLIVGFDLISLKDYVDYIKNILRIN